MASADRHFVSIVICTYNRVASLRETLSALEALHDVGFSQEWIIVDNNSTDDTAQFLAAYAATQPRLRVLYEPRQGKSYALNTGIAAARGDIIAFTDDDVRPAPDWLLRLLDVYDHHDAAAVGGRVVLEQTAALPAWLPASLVPYLGLVDYGANLKVIQPPEALVGANLSVRKDILDQVGAFNTDLGPRGHNYAVVYNEDTDFCDRVVQLGAGALLYAPQVVTYHALMPDKLTRRYFRQRGWGEGKVRAQREPPAARRQLGWRLLGLVIAGARFPVAWLKYYRQPDVRFLRQYLLIREASTVLALARAALGLKAQR